MKEASIKRIWHRSLLGLGLVLAVTLLSHGPLYATAFTWSGLPIQGEAGQEYPNYFPAGQAEFEVVGSSMTLLLTYTGGSENIQAINQAMTALTWEMTGYTGTLQAESALIASGSSLVGVDSDSWPGVTDLSGQWAFKDNIQSELLGNFGVGTMGDINFQEDSFGSHDVIDPNKTFVSPSPGNIDFAIIGPNITTLSTDGNGNPDGFKNQGPVVQNAMLFEFVFLNSSGNLLDQAGNDITFSNAQALYGTEGVPAVPEPATVLLLGTGLVGLVGFRKKLKK
jgi:hypothetical protein